MQDAIADMLGEAQAGFPNLSDDPEQALRILLQISRNLEPEQRCTTICCHRAIDGGIRITKQMLRG
jgi:hypothetical protein